MDDEAGGTRIERTMINLRVGFSPLHAFPLLEMFLLQVPRINGMKYRINFFALVSFSVCFERTRAPSTNDDVYGLSTEVE